MENIARMIQAVMDLDGDFHILIVDDNSPDGTAEIVEKLIPDYMGRLFILNRPGKQGLGTAYIAGFKWALDKGYEYIFEMDADFSHDPNDLIRLYESCKEDGADVAIGSRYVKGGSVKNWPANRIFISYSASIYTRMITWMPVKDCTAGFICYTRKVLEHIALDEVKFIGYAFQIEMKYRAWKKGFQLKEVPITFVDRKEGLSKMSKGIIKEAVFGVWKMRTFNQNGKTVVAASNKNEQ
ncbi:MAG: polyprenol monophosphomannose synthase [Taibaiella sp.]|nr:polyprenol monophosphomannose synthase [Taibaiella sp.]